MRTNERTIRGLSHSEHNKEESTGYQAPKTRDLKTKTDSQSGNKPFDIVIMILNLFNKHGLVDKHSNKDYKYSDCMSSPVYKK